MISEGCDLLIDQDKIILMTKLAVYEKKYIKEDRRRNGYYLEDYIYVKNFKTRLSVTLAFISFAALDTMKKVSENLIFPTSLEGFVGIYIKPYIMSWIIVLIGYTILSTIIYEKRYALSQKGLKRYNLLLKKLNTYDQDKANEERITYESE